MSTMTSAAGAAAAQQQKQAMAALTNPMERPKDPEQGMKEAAELLNSAALAIKRRRCLVTVDEVPGFVRTVYTLLRVCDPEIIAWSEDGTQIVIKAAERFAAEVCPKFFRHRNFNSFTRLLNMYQFHKVPTSRRDSKEVCFEHPHFRRGREDLLPLVQRKGAQMMREELVAREIFERNLVHHHQQLAGWAMAQAQQRSQQQHPSLESHNQGGGGAGGGADVVVDPCQQQGQGQHHQQQQQSSSLAQAQAQQQQQRPRLAPTVATSSASSSSASSASSEPPSPKELNPSATTAALESALQPLHHQLDPTGWMRRMALLETEVRALKYENDRLKSLEREKDTLTAQIAAQADLITHLQAQSNFVNTCVVDDHDRDDASSPASTDDEATAAAAPEFNSPEFQALIQSVGGPVGAVAMMLNVLGGVQQQQQQRDDTPLQDQPPHKKQRTSSSEEIPLVVETA